MCVNTSFCNTCAIEMHPPTEHINVDDLLRTGKPQTLNRGDVLLHSNGKIGTHVPFVSEQIPNGSMLTFSNLSVEIPIGLLPIKTFL